MGSIDMQSFTEEDLCTILKFDNEVTMAKVIHDVDKLMKEFMSTRASFKYKLDPDFNELRLTIYTNDNTERSSEDNQ
jgi:hypothetical protein